MKPKLLIITNRFVIGGPAFHVAELTRFLQDDFDVLIVGGIAGKGEETNIDMFEGLKSEPVTVEGFSRIFNPLSDYRAYGKIKKIIAEFKPDIVHTHTFKPGFIGRLAARSLKVKTIVHTFHGNLFTGYFHPFISRLLVLIERFLARKSSAIIALSPKQKDELVKKYRVAGSDKIRLIFPGIAKERFSPDAEKRKAFREKYKLEDDEIALGIIGRLVTVKNIKLFIDGIKHLIDSGFSKVTGFIVGDGKQKYELTEYCKKTGLDFVRFSYQKNKAPIVFTGWCKDITSVYQGVDAVVLTSLNEGTPYSLLEAQAAGKPVITADVGGVSDIVDSGKSAFVFKEREEFFGFLEKVVGDRNLRLQMGEKGKAFIKQGFDSQKMALETKKLYLELIRPPA